MVATAAGSPPSAAPPSAVIGPGSREVPTHRLDARVLASLANAPILLAVVAGPNHIYEFANRRYRELCGLIDPVGEPFGTSLAEVIPGRDMAALLDRVYQQGDAIELVELEARVTRPNADPSSPETMYFDVTLEPTYDPSGAVDGVTILGVDVTAAVIARRRLDSQRLQVARQREALRESESVLHAALRNAPIAIAAIDRRGIVKVCEGREVGRLGVDPRERIGASVLQIYKDRPATLERFQRVLAGEEVAWAHERNGHSFESRAVPLRDDEGNVTGAVVVVTNVTEQRHAEQERQQMQAKLLHAQKLESLGVLAGGIAHDFNNLLTAIMGHASLALASLPSNTPAYGAIADLASAAHRAADLTRQLLAYSGRGTFSIRPIDLSVHVGEIAHLLETTVPKKVSLTLDLAPSLPAVEADVAQIQQIVMNLVMNGAEAIGDRRGSLRVRTAEQELDERACEALEGAELRPGRYVFLEVADDGCGMDAATRSRIFDPFFTTKLTGRGLGLAAVSGIVRAHKGGIHIETAPDRGTTFRVYFPASARAPEGRAHKVVVSYRGEGTVLLADDEAHVRGVTRRILEHFGFDVLEASNGREALEVFEAERDRIALVILDLTMPELGGPEALRAMRALRPDVKVILASGYSEADTRSRLASEVPDGFLEKPFTTGELATRLAAVLGTKA